MRATRIAVSVPVGKPEGVEPPCPNAVGAEPADVVGAPVVELMRTPATGTPRPRWFPPP